MGVTIITEWKARGKKSIKEAFDDCYDKLEISGAERQGAFKIECESFHRPMDPSSKTFHVVTTSEYPASQFVQFDDGPAMTTDRQMGSFLNKLSTIWQQKKGGKLEIKGHVFKYEDFEYKIGVVSHGSVSIGISFELEYQPSLWLRDCWMILQLQLRDILGDQTPLKKPRALVLKEAEPYEFETTVVQYLELFSKIRSAAR